MVKHQSQTQRERNQKGKDTRLGGQTQDTQHMEKGSFRRRQRNRWRRRNGYTEENLPELKKIPVTTD